MLDRLLDRLDTWVHLWLIPRLQGLPRTTVWALVAVLLLLGVLAVAPVQLPIVLYKAALVAVAAVLGYWIDRGVFPYARPDGYLVNDWRDGDLYRTGEDVSHPVVVGYEIVFLGAMLRRAVVVAAVVLALALGL